MDRQPHLETERLILRPLHEDDFAALYAVARDREIWAMHPAHDRWQEPVFRRFFDEALSECGALAIIERASGQIIGSSRYALPDPDHPDELEVGWSFLARKFWGAGYNAEFKRAMIEHALRHYDRVIFQVGEDNLISRKAMENIGGMLTDRFRTIFRNGREVGHVIYAITRDSFSAGPLRT